MGLVLNPTGYRIGYTKYWFDSWYLHRINYPVFVHKSLEMKLLFEYALRRRRFLRNFWIYSHITYHYFNNKFHVNVFIYDGNNPQNYFNLAKNLRWGWYSRSKFYNRFTKKTLLDQRYFYQRLWCLCQIFNFELETLSFDSLRWRYPFKSLEKIAKLKKRYGKKWVAREQLVPQLISILFTMYNKYNKMGLQYFHDFFKIYILKFIKRSFNYVRKPIRKTRKLKKLSLFKKKKYLKHMKNIKKNKIIEIRNLKYIVKSYKKFYMFFSFLDKFFRIAPTYPKRIFNKLLFKNLFRFFRMYFVFRPYWYQVSKYYEILFLYININAKVSIYVLENRHLSAQYIAHYIMTSFKYRFDQRDTYIPIRRTLNRILFVKIWGKSDHVEKYIWNKYSAEYKDFFIDRKKFYKNFFFLSYLDFYFSRKLKKINYFKLKISKYSRKNRKLIKFNIVNFKKNLYEIKNFFFNNNLLFIKKKIINLSKKKFIFNKFLVKYTKRFFNILFKNNIIRKLFYYNEKNNIKLKKNSYIYINLKKNITIYKKKKMHKDIIQSYRNIKAKFLPLKLKLRRFKILNLKKRILNSRKFFLIKNFFISLYFQYINLKKKNFFIFEKIKKINNNYLFFFKAVQLYIYFMQTLRLSITKYKYVLKKYFYLTRHMKAAKSKAYKFYYTKYKMNCKYFISEFNKKNESFIVRLGNKKFFIESYNLILKNHIIKKKNFSNIYKFFIFSFFNLLKIQYNLKNNFINLIKEKELFKINKFDKYKIKLKIKQKKIKPIKHKVISLLENKKHDKNYNKFPKNGNLKKQNNKNYNKPKIIDKRFGIPRTDTSMFDEKLKNKNQLDLLYKLVRDVLTQEGTIRQKNESLKKQYNKNYNKFSKNEIKNNKKKLQLNNINEKYKKVFEIKKKLRSFFILKKNKLKKIIAIINYNNKIKKKIKFDVINLIKERKLLEKKIKNNKKNNKKLWQKVKIHIKKFNLKKKIINLLMKNEKIKKKIKVIIQKIKLNSNNKLKKKLNYYIKYLEFNTKSIYKKNKKNIIKKKKKYNWYFKKGYFYLFINFFINKYSKNYFPFVFNLNSYGNYLQYIYNLPLLEDQIKNRQIKKKNLQVTPLINKFKRLKTLEGDRINVLYGYKFHFSGRFSRKQKAASLWYTKGANPVSSMNYDVEYGFHTITLRYSACTLKVWLYKNKRVSFKYSYKLV